MQIEDAGIVSGALCRQEDRVEDERYEDAALANHNTGGGLRSAMHDTNCSVMNDANRAEYHNTVVNADARTL